MPALSAKRLATTRPTDIPVELIDGFLPGLRVRIASIVGRVPTVVIALIVGALGAFLSIKGYMRPQRG